MLKNWMCYFELLLVDDKGDGIKIFEFKVIFNIQKMFVIIFNGFVGNFKVYNLFFIIQNWIMQKEFLCIQVIVGYKG